MSFRSIVPGAYPGRWPHIHFEVYRSLAEATDSDAAITTSQIALPQELCAATYSTAGYEASARTFAGTSIGDDNVFGDDDGVTQIPTSSGDAAGGWSVLLTVPA